MALCVTALVGLSRSSVRLPIFIIKQLRYIKRKYNTTQGHNHGLNDTSCLRKRIPIAQPSPNIPTPPTSCLRLLSARLRSSPSSSGGSGSGTHSCKGWLYEFVAFSSQLKHAVCSGNTVPANVVDATTDRVLRFRCATSSSAPASRPKLMFTLGMMLVSFGKT